MLSRYIFSGAEVYAEDLSEDEDMEEGEDMEDTGSEDEEGSSEQGRGGGQEIRLPTGWCQAPGGTPTLE